MSTGALVRRAARGSTALRGGRVRRLTPYQLFGLLFWLLMTLAYWRLPPCCDAGRHAAAVEGLRAGLADPGVSPYVLAQGAVARLTGLSGWQVLRLCGPLNLLVLLTGLGRLVRVLTPRPLAPVLALAFMAVLWGTEPARGGASVALLPLTGSLGYPSAFALGLTFWAWALTGARARDLRRMRYVGPTGLRSPTGYATLGVLYGVVALVDPVLGVGAAAGAVAFTAGWQRGWRGAVWMRWALLCAVAAGVVILGTHAHMPPQPYERYDAMPAQCWLALLLGAPPLWLRSRRATGHPGNSLGRRVAGRGRGRAGRRVAGRGEGRAGLPVAGRGEGPAGLPVAGRGEGPAGLPVAGRGRGRAGRWVAGRSEGPAGLPVAGRSEGPAGLPVAGRSEGPAGLPVAGRGRGRAGRWVAGRGEGRAGLRVAGRRGGRVGWGVAGGEWPGGRAWWGAAWLDPLVLLFAAESLVMAAGGRRHGFGELLGLALLAPQCALAVELAAPRPWPRWRRALGWAAAAGTCLGFLAAQAGAVVPRSVDPVGFVQPPRWPSYDWAVRHIGPGEPVLTDAYYAVRLLPGYGVELADDHDHRPRVRWLLLTRWERLPAEAVVVDWSRRTGEVLARLTRTRDVPVAARPTTRR
ncbi:hypothetical protein ABZ619_34730 [Streptomyces sp. NPDC007851]|uniref:hypothetical protein n=1 Tax=Streptomyces sp. NPDC007851 TaxID=3155008 RepID=UPI0033FDFAE1